METIRITGTQLQNVEDFARREWLITNGIGGFASQSLVGANARGYHGLLVAALKPPVERTLLISKLDETIHLKGTGYELGTNLYWDDVAPQGYTYLASFQYSFHPVLTYEVAGHILEKRIFMVYGENTTVVEYRHIDGTEPLDMELTPHLNYRDYHGNTRREDWLRHHEGLIHFKEELEEPYWFLHKQGPQYTFTAFEGATPFYMTVVGDWIEDRRWVEGVYYPIEEHRGLKSVEDHFIPGRIKYRLEPGESLTVVFSTLDKYRAEMHASELYLKEVDRVEELLELAWANEPIKRRLVVAADQFIVRRALTNTATVIAGYPWFTDWGRDSMIAFPGLVLVTHRWREGREILETFASHSRHGLIPNRFPDEGEEPEYNTVDASLWFFVAFYQYFWVTHDQAFLLKNLPLLKKMINHHIEGTLWQIKMEEDCLLTQGEAGVQLTWMDAKVGDWVVTPRQGKAVEINALWYNAVKITAIFADLEDTGTGREYAKLAECIYQSFREQFWNEEGGYLYDRIEGDRKDPTIRPNQIFALSLPFPLLDRKEGATMLKVVREHLLTPFGLRSLSVEDEDYHGYFGGDQRQRDAAYHQGTVWSWLIGPYAEALLYVEGATPRTKEKVKRLLDPLLAHLKSDGAIGQVSEIFSGDRPYTPEGCFAQAWSVAEILRIWELIN